MKRDIRIDTWRGYALVIITTSHTPFAWRMLIPDCFGYVGAAQIFFFLSGLVGGLVYARLSDRAPARELWRKALGRAGLIWIVHVGTCVLLMAALHVGRALGSGWAPAGGPFLLERPVLALALGALGLHLPAFTDILPMYVVLALAMPAVVLAIRRGHGLVVMVVVVSLWLSAQLGVEDRIVAWLGTKVAVHLPYFRFTGWQVVIVAGLALGVAWARGRLDRLRVGPALALALLAAHAALFLVKHGLWPDDAVSGTIRALAPGETHGLVPTLDLVLVLGLAVFLGRTVPALFVSRWAALLGRHSLAVFGFHLAMMYAIALLEIREPRAQIAITLAAITALTLPAWIAERRRITSRREA